MKFFLLVSAFAAAALGAPQWASPIPGSPPELSVKIGDVSMTGKHCPTSVSSFVFTDHSNIIAFVDWTNITHPAPRRGEGLAKLNCTVSIPVTFPAEDGYALKIKNSTFLADVKLDRGVKLLGGYTTTLQWYGDYRGYTGSVTTETEAKGPRRGHYAVDHIFPYKLSTEGVKQNTVYLEAGFDIYFEGRGKGLVEFLAYGENGEIPTIHWGLEWSKSKK